LRGGGGVSVGGRLFGVLLCITDQPRSPVPSARAFPTGKPYGHGTSAVTRELAIPPLLLAVTLQNKIVPHAKRGRHLHESHCMIILTNGHDRLYLYSPPTILCLWFGRKPLWPFSRIHFSQLDLVLGIVGLGVTTAVWKLDVSLLNGVTAVHVAVLMRRRGGWWEWEWEWGCWG
jgi:hypothetical protein